jgi:hypothetical protein
MGGASSGFDLQATRREAIEDRYGRPRDDEELLDIGHGEQARRFCKCTEDLSRDHCCAHAVRLSPARVLLRLSDIGTALNYLAIHAAFAGAALLLAGALP